MKATLFCSLLLAGAALVSGCRTYDYRLIQPTQLAQPITGEQVVTLRLEPLEYRFWRDHDRLAMRITNPTEDRIVLMGNRSFVVDPRGESHPLRGQVIGPHSFTTMLLPPRPASAQVVGGYGPGWGWGPGWAWGPGWGPGFYGDWYYGPTTTYYQLVTPYDWNWDTGPARLRLSYDREGKFFDHNLEFVRERAK